MVLRSIDTVNPGLGISAGLGDRALALYPQTLTACLGDLAKPESFGGLKGTEFIRDGAIPAPVKAAIDATDPDNLRIRTPVRIEQGSADATVLPPFTEQLRDTYKTLGNPVTYTSYNGVSHGGIVDAAAKTPRSSCPSGSRAAAARAAPPAASRRQEPRLPPPDVAPGAGLEADVAVHADQLEAHRLVQSHAGVVGQRDPGARDLEPLPGQQGEQRRVELAADAAPVAGGVHVDGDVDRPAVRGAGAVLGAVRVARRLAVALGHQPRIRLRGGRDPLVHLLCGRRLLLEGGHALPDVRGVDGGAGRGVAVRVGVAHHCR